MGYVGRCDRSDLPAEYASWYSPPDRILKEFYLIGSFQPVDGLIYSQNGVVQCEEGQSLNPRQIITMNWLAENVIGCIPEAEELTDEAQALLKLQGVRVDENACTEAK